MGTGGTPGADTPQRNVSSACRESNLLRAGPKKPACDAAARFLSYADAVLWVLSARISPGSARGVCDRFAHAPPPRRRHHGPRARRRQLTHPVSALQHQFSDRRAHLRQQWFSLEGRWLREEGLRPEPGVLALRAQPVSLRVVALGYG